MSEISSREIEGRLGVELFKDYHKTLRFTFLNSSVKRN